YVTGASVGFLTVTTNAAAAAGRTVAAAGLRPRMCAPATTVGGRSSTPGVPWLEKSTVAPRVTARASPGRRPETVDRQVSVWLVAPAPKTRSHSRTSKSGPATIRVGATLNEPGTTATPVPFGTRARAVAAIPWGAPTR